MPVEVAIFGGNHRMLQVRRNPLDRNEFKPLAIGRAGEHRLHAPLHLNTRGGRINVTQRDQRDGPEYVQARDQGERQS